MNKCDNEDIQGSDSLSKMGGEGWVSGATCGFCHSELLSINDSMQWQKAPSASSGVVLGSLRAIFVGDQRGKS